MPDASASGWQSGQSPRLPLFCDCTDGEPVVTEVVVPAGIVGIEADAARVARVVRIERQRPVMAVGTGTVKIRAAPVACGWKEDGLAVGARDESSIYSVLGWPSPGAFGP